MFPPTSPRGTCRSKRLSEMSVEPWLWRRTSSQNGEPVAPPSARSEGDRADDHPANLAPSAQYAVLDEMCCSGARDLTIDNGRNTA